MLWRLERLRSVLSVPGQRASMIAKSLESAADAIALDLEDSVPWNLKDAARGMVADAVGRPSRVGGPARLVRVNGTATGRLDADIRAVVRPGLAAIVLPKVEKRGEITHADRLLTVLEDAQAIRTGTVRLVISVESARGLRNVEEMADASRRNVALLFGGEDFAADLGLLVERTGQGAEQIYARSRIVVVAASARLFALDQVCLEYKDLETFRRHAEASRQLGFTTAFCVHPSQVPVANATFSPSAADVELAQRVIAGLEKATDAGVGAVTLDGHFIEQPIVERARRTLRLAGAISHHR